MKSIKRIIPVILIIALLLSCATCALASGTVSFVTTGKCHMRKDPNLNGKEITTLPKGASFNATDAKDDERGVTWYYGSYNGKTGWVSSKYLKKTSGGGDSGSTAEKATYVTTATAYMRKAPNLDGEKIATLKEGSKLNATEYKKDSRGVKWHYGTCDGKTGWVSEKNLEKVSAPKPTPKPTPKPIDYSKFKTAGYYVVVTASSLNMRKEPSSEYAVIDSYKEGSVLYAVRSNGSWAEVLDEDTKRTGYMSEKYLERYVESAPAYEAPAAAYEDPAPTFTDPTPIVLDPVFMEPEPIDLTYEATADVVPNPVEVNLAAPEDGIYPVSFLPEDLVSVDGIIMLKNLHLFTQDTYDIVDIAQLQPGKTILINGEVVRINTIDRGDFVMINGGLDAGGWNLRAVDEGNCFVVWDLDDATTYTDHGAVTLPLGGTVVYTDDSDLENHVTADINTILDTVGAEGNPGYNPYNTTVRIEMGIVKEIARIYVP